MDVNDCDRNVITDKGSSREILQKFEKEKTDAGCFEAKGKVNLLITGNHRLLRFVKLYIFNFLKIRKQTSKITQLKNKNN